MNYFDLILIILTVLTIYTGYRKGLLYSLAEIVSLVVGLPLSAYVSRNFTGDIYDGFVKQLVIDYLTKKIDKQGSLVVFLEGLQNSTIFSQLLGDESDLTAFALLGKDGVIAVIEENLVRPVALVIIECLLFILVIILFSIVIAIIKSIVKPKKRDNDKPLSKTNRIFGALLGAVKAVITLVIFSTLAYYLTEYFNNGNDMIKTIGDSFIVNIINQFNPFAKPLA